MSTAVPTRRHTLLQRAALVVSAALATWAETSAERDHPALEGSRSAAALQQQRQEAERRREAAITQRLLLPRQF
ncbi:hypothetical protein [Nesterenkonia alkaliphila]|uniref:Uncharacterized protein n=1 Tax=Nesterenkonia alkaliphila TaxID=1463631 RepID=A0A7K1UFZ1_9MICC|nr:hypothetical protein [Nesterenkonia alkaliphila]MVT25011.1 hypothetical protein [Nesterenkonia alkaliphila]GFZ87185.1 hypothetical protein GCM10011359_15640 [Nesterenkonia alkaliphila]